VRRQAALGRAIKRVPERLMRAFTAYSWPGNVRELENVIERALVMTSGAVLDECAWKISGRGNAADRLGLKRSTLQFRTRKLGIARPGSGE
jgi:formate hydrogenlyase transcriptional activator